MLIGICGSISAGKQSVADFLTQQQGFVQLYLVRQTPLLEPASQVKLSTSSSACERIHTFLATEDLLDFITKQWQHRWVTTDIWDEHILETLRRRPSFLLVSVDAPVSLRWKRYKARCATESALVESSWLTEIHRCEENHATPPTLETFVIQNDDHLYHQHTGLARLIDRAEVRLVNQTLSLDTLYQALKDLDLTNEQRLRPNWDQYFMQLASLAAQRSNCMKRRVGCVLVRDKRVISTGYNGTPRYLKNCNEGGCESRSAKSLGVENNRF
ncbi:MAG: hypothetical protein Q9190_006942 [Brigantiaea leucoxantha]